MCLGVPAKVLKMAGSRCIAEIMGVTREVSLDLLNDVREGDWIMLHAGCAIALIDEQEALATLELLDELREVEEARHGEFV